MKSTDIGPLQRVGFLTIPDLRGGTPTSRHLMSQTRGQTNGESDVVAKEDKVYTMFLLIYIILADLRINLPQM